MQIADRSDLLPGLGEHNFSCPFQYTSVGDMIMCKTVADLAVRLPEALP